MNFRKIRKKRKGSFDVLQKWGLENLEQGSQTQFIQGPQEVESGLDWAASSIPQKSDYKFNKVQLLQSAQPLLNNK